MKPRGPRRLSEEQRGKMRRAVRLEWVTIFFLVTITVVMGLAMGSSQAMKAAWIEDLLSLIPPIAFLVAARFQKKPPDARFPYGRGRAMSLSFLVASTAVLAFGLFILIDSVMKLARAEHPSLGLFELFGHRFWSGWLMIAALTYSVIPPVVLGRMKHELACELHEKTLHADAAMNRADWMTGLAGILGVIGVGFGFWWADGVAAGVISLNIVKDGAEQIKHSFGDLMDRRPERIERDRPDPLAREIRRCLERLDWVERADVRLREEGQLLAGEGFVVPVAGTKDLPQKLERAGDALRKIHWRVGDVVVTAVSELEPASKEEQEARKESAADRAKAALARWLTPSKV